MHDLAVQAPLRPRPSPRATTIPIEAVEQHRDVFCRHLDDCLDEAVKRNWPAFSCAGCPLKGQAQIKPELRVGGDCALADVAEGGGGAMSRELPTATMADAYRRLLRTPQTAAEIARGNLQAFSVMASLRRLEARGIARRVTTSQSSGASGTVGWVRTGQRICEGCQERLPASAYDVSTRSPDRLRVRCRDCTQGMEAAYAKRKRARRGK